MNNRNHKFKHEKETTNYIIGHDICLKCELEAWQMFSLMNYYHREIVDDLYLKNNMIKCYPQDLELFNKFYPCISDEELIIKKLLE